MLAFVRQHGIVLRDARDENSGSAESLSEVFLPNPSLDDPPSLDLAPIQLELTAKNLNDFEQGGCHAATFLGPAAVTVDTGKTQNEDFALAGTIEGASGPVTFGIVADGVTLKTFWPARASRIAAFAAYETLSELVSKGWVPGNSDENGIDAFISDLCSRLQVRFSEDLCELTHSNNYPDKWKSEIFLQHKDNLEFWYNTTLLLTILGKNGGWFIFCGDGGAVRILVRNGQRIDVKTVLETTDTLELSSAVSVSVTPRNFARRFIKPPTDGCSLHMVMSSDGVDRSLKNRNTVYTALDLSSGKSVHSALQTIAQWPEADKDNMSLVHVCFPPGAAWPLPDKAAVAEPLAGLVMVDTDAVPTDVQFENEPQKLKSAPAAQGGPVLSLRKAKRLGQVDDGSAGDSAHAGADEGNRDVSAEPRADPNLRLVMAGFFATGVLAGIILCFTAIWLGSHR